MHAKSVLIVLVAVLVLGSVRAECVEFERIVVDRTFRAEGCAVGDINHDGKLDIFSGDVWYSGPDFKMHELRAVGTYDGTKGYSNCFANFAEDVNGDGRADVLVKEGWWEAPKNLKKGNWKWHPANLGEDCANLLVYDVDDDGDNDVITSSAHRYGIWWFEQLEDGKFKQHEITKEYSQPHAIILADMNRDGIMDLVTGKRHLAHQGNDPGGKDPAMLYWLELTRKDGKPKFTTHVIDDDSGVGTQFEVTDMNGDKKLDIVTSNKKGVRVFLQK